MVALTVENCICSNLPELSGRDPLEVFADVRSGCPVLSRIFVYDEDWPAFQQWHVQHVQSDNVAHHRSSLLLAMERGCLGRITAPVHRFLLDDNGYRKETNQYLQDLREQWMFEQDPVERNRKFRIFSGHLVELQFAEWLEKAGWHIMGLEALRNGPDVEADGGNHRHTAFELKYIGVEDDDFRRIQESLAGQPPASSVSPYHAANFLLFRVYEAAKQLQRINSDRVAVVVISEASWWRFDSQLSNNWIDWANPKFYPGHEWMETQIQESPHLQSDLNPALQTLSAVWILKRTGDYRYSCMFKFQLGKA